MINIKTVYAVKHKPTKTIYDFPIQTGICVIQTVKSSGKFENLSRINNTSVLKRKVQ